MDKRIAIIGVSGRFPQSETLEDFLEGLLKGTNFVIEPSERRREYLPKSAQLVQAAYLDRIDTFDYEHFGFSLGEARVLDPKQRILLELTKEVIHAAGLTEKSLQGKAVGTYIGSNVNGKNNYTVFCGSHHPSAGPGNLQAALAGRIAHCFGFSGPAMVVDTACSSSLVAVAQACDNLLIGQIDYALAGGLELMILPPKPDIVQGASILSTDFHCRPFDAAANGTAFGEGGGLVLLARLADAEKLGLPILATVASWGLNQDGGRCNGFTSPSPSAQTNLIESVLKRGNVPLEKLSYVETHGTATKIGDPIEAQALIDVLRNSNRSAPVPVGSVKGNIGHLDSAAGIASLIKAVLCIKASKAPPIANFTSTNPNIAASQEQLCFPTHPFPLPIDGYIGVSSFGLTGTNAHVVIQGIEQGAGYFRSRLSGLKISGRTVNEFKRGVSQFLSRGSLSEKQIAAYNLYRDDEPFRRFVFDQGKGLQGALADLEANVQSHGIEPVTKPESLVILLSATDFEFHPEGFKYTSILNEADKAWQSTRDKLACLGVLKSIGCEFKLITTQFGKKARLLFEEQITEDEFQRSIITEGIPISDEYIDRNRLQSLYETLNLSGQTFYLSFSSDCVIAKSLTELGADVGQIPNSPAHLISLMYQAGFDIPWSHFYDDARPDAIERWSPWPTKVWTESQPDSIAEYYGLITTESEAVAAPFEQQKNCLTSSINQAWCEALGIEQIGDDEDWFDLGGDSISGEMIVQKVNKILGTSYSFDLIDNHPTLGELVSYLRSQEKFAEPSHASSKTNTTATDHAQDMRSFLIEVWKETLGTRVITEKDDWFDLGGDSISGELVIQKINERMKSEYDFELIYKYPTLGELVATLEEVERSREHHYAQKCPEIKSTTPIQTETEKLFPLTSSQLQLWYLCKFSNLSDAYNVPIKARLKGTSLTSITQTLDIVFKRHHALGIRIQESNGTPHQFIETNSHKGPSICIDSSGASLWKTEDGTKMDAIALGHLDSSFFSQPFLFDGSSLARAVVLDQGAGDYELWLNFSHIIVDGWSMALIMKELREIHNQVLKGETLDVQPVVRHYSSFCLEHQEYLNSPVFSQQRNFWSGYLSDSLNPPQLPRDSFNVHNENRKETKHTSLQDFTYKEISQYAASFNGTPFCVFMCALSLTIHYHGNESTFDIAVPSANRDVAKDSQTVGHFVNTLVYRATVDAATTFAELMRSTVASHQQITKNRAFPFNEVVRMCSRSGSKTPELTVMLAYQNVPHQENLTDECFTFDVLPNKSSKFPLLISVYRNEDSFKLAVEYNPNLFMAVTIDRFVSTYVAVIQGLLQGFAEPISYFNPRLEHSSILSTPAVEPGGEGFLARVREIVKLHPNKPALSDRHCTLTFYEAWAASDTIAAHLIDQSVPENAIIGIMIEKSVDWMLAMLGARKAGCVFVPIDPNLPERRIKDITTEAGIQVVLTNCELPKANHLRSIRIDQIPSTTLSQMRHAELMYVMFTSGTSGKPKGVKIRESSVLNLVDGLWSEVYQEVDIKRVTVTAPFHFDASVQQWSMLTKGIAIYIVSEDERNDPNAFCNLLKEQKIDLYDCTPSYLSTLLTSTSSVPSSVKAALVGGEAIDPFLWQRLVEQTDTQYYNVYGPTECTVDSTIMRIDEPMTVPCIGQPLPGATIHIVNPKGETLPAGWVGEILIEGAGVSPGYINTASSAFISRKSDDPWGKAYRTGDLGRLTGADTIEYLGRNDHQVKINGYRIELGEIANVTLDHPLIQIAHAFVSTSGDLKMICLLYIAQRPVEEFELRTYLQGRLPHYMQPRHVLQVKTLPMNDNGKVDIRTAENWIHQQGTQPAPKEDRLPRNQQEQDIWDIWSSVLQTTDFGIDDNFYHLGGYSIAAARIVSSVNLQQNTNASIMVLLQKPTVRAFAEALRLTPSMASINKISPMQASRYPLSKLQQSIWYAHELATSPQSYNIVQAFTLRTIDDICRFREAINSVVRKNWVLTSKIFIKDSEVVQEYEKQDDYTTIFEKAGSLEVQRIIESELAFVYDLVSPAKIRNALVVDKNTDTISWVLSMHHIASDGMSINLFIKDVLETYKNLGCHGYVMKPEARLQYGDYTISLAKSGRYQNNLNAWRQRLRHSQELPILDGLRMATADTVESSLTDFREYSLSKEHTSALRGIATAFDCSEFNVCCALLATTFHQITKKSDFTFGIPFSNRETQDTFDMIGLFLNTLPLQVRIDEHSTLRGVLNSLQREHQFMVEHQDVVFEDIAELLSGTEDKAHHRCPIEIFVNYIKYNERERDYLADIEPIDLNKAYAKFPLSIYIGSDADVIHFSFVFNASHVTRVVSDYIWSSIESLLPQFITAKPDTFLSTLAKTPESHLQHLLSHPPTTTRQESILHRVLNQSDSKRLAILTSKESWTYADLRIFVGKLRTSIRKYALPPGSTVILLATRSSEYVASLIAVMAEGLVALPVKSDDLNEERVRVIEATLAPRLCIMQCPAPSPLDALRLNVINSQNVLVSDLRPLPEDVDRYLETMQPAYLFFTSGSTGKPKLIQGCLLGLSHFIHEQSSLLSVHSPISAFTTEPTFDVSLRDIFISLSNEGSLCIPDQDDLTHGNRFIPWVRKQSVNILHLVPSIARIIVDTYSKEEPAVGLKAVCFGGEQLPRILIKKWRDKILTSSAEIYNVYGPTETTLAASFCKQDLYDQGTPYIDQGLPGKQIFVLDECDAPCPPFQAGRLFIRTPYRSFGYLSNFEGTFRSLQSGIVSSARDSFDTRDLGYYTLDGRIVITGRSDHVVKIHGVKVNPSEISRTLQGHFPMVAFAATVRNDDIICYFTGADSRDLAESIKKAAVQKLPTHLVPNHFVFVTEFPLNKNGKISFNLLPVPQPRSGPVVRPRTRYEESLCRMFETILNQPTQSVTTSFFESGGNSMKAMLLRGAIQEEYSFDISMRDIFQLDRIEAIANLMQHRSTEEKSTPQVGRIDRSKLRKFSEKRVT